MSFAVKAHRQLELQLLTSPSTRFESRIAAEDWLSSRTQLNLTESPALMPLPPSVLQVAGVL